MEKFLEIFKEQLEDTDPTLIQPNTAFKELEEWSSLMSICIIAAIDDEYQVPVKANEMLQTETIQDLYNLVVSKQQ